MSELHGRVVIIKRKVPSQNQSQYRHWSLYHQEKEAWYILLRAQFAPRKPREEPMRMVLRSYRSRLMDYANLVGGAKPIPDALIRLGVLKDDSPRWFHCEYYQFQVPKIDERTELEFIPWSGFDHMIEPDR